MSGPGAPTPRVSVVVPTRDRADSLRACLAALASQAAPAAQTAHGDADLEVVVVDDASRDAAAVDAAAASHARARVVRGEGRGPAAARNRGVSAARGDRIVFLDDDCRPEPGWLPAIVAAFDAGAAVVAGRTDPDRHDPYAVATQLITNHLMHSTRGGAPATVTFAPTCNLGCRRDVHADLAFDERFPLAAGEDREWCARVVDAGLTIAFAPDAVVVHAPALSWKRFWRQHERYGRGTVHFGDRTGVRLQPVRFYAALVRAAFADGARTGALVLVAQVATAVGAARERFGAARRGR